LGINIELRYQSGFEGGALIEDLGVVDGDELPYFDDLRYPYLRLIDPYSDTVLSQYQITHAVLDELERFAADETSPGISRLLEAARRCAGNVRTALWLIGD
jgi:hypothetical protein